MSKGKSKSQPKARTSVLLPIPIRDGMRVVREVARILPSHQIELAIREYLLTNHGEILKARGIQL